MQEKAEVLLELSRPGPRELPAQYPQLPRYSNHFLILPYTNKDAWNSLVLWIAPGQDPPLLSLPKA